MFLWGTTFRWRQVKFVEAEGRRKVEGLWKYLVDEKKNTFLDALGLELFPWPLLSLFSLLRKFWALFLEFFGLRWALHSRSFVRRPLVPRFYKVSTMALPGDTSSSSVSVLGTTIGNHTQAPHFVGSCRCLWVSWTMGIFFGIGKGWIPDMKILDNKMYQSCMGWQISVVTWIPKGHK